VTIATKIVNVRAMEKQFRITWSIDEWAENPIDAIKKAIESMPTEANPDSIATVFEVIEVKNGKFVEGSAKEIDLQNVLYFKNEGGFYTTVLTQDGEPTDENEMYEYGTLQEFSFETKKGCIKFAEEKGLIPKFN
jgi:hypothetical protein